MNPRRFLRAAVWIVGATLSCLVGAASARAEEPAAQLLPAPYVRAGRPVVVRVPGASRVRAASGPWALAQGAASDEFVLQVHRADVGLGDLEIEDLSGAVRRVPLRAEALPATGHVRAVLGGGGAAPTDVVVDISAAGQLPTVPEAWLLFDEVAGDAEAATMTGPARAALDAWRRDLRASETPALEPLRLAPDEHAFRAAAEAASTAARLPRDVSVALLVAAGTTLLLLLVTRGGGSPRGTAAAPQPAPWRRIGWVCAPSAACLAWFAFASPLPGAVRATSFVVAGDAGASAFVRFETDVAAEISFALPDGASSAAVLAWDEGDTTVRDAEAGRLVRLVLPPAAVRIVAWRLPPSDGATAADVAPAGGETTRWLRRLGLEPAPGPDGAAAEGSGGASGPDVSLRGARGFRLIPAGVIRVATRK